MPLKRAELGVRDPSLLLLIMDSPIDPGPIGSGPIGTASKTITAVMIGIFTLSSGDRAYVLPLQYLRKKLLWHQK